MFDPKKPKAANGWGVVDRFGKLYPDIWIYRKHAISTVSEDLGRPWKALYRQGFRCIRVTLIPSTATMMDALAGITGADA